jgi:hypothetical protein
MRSEIKELVHNNGSKWAVLSPFLAASIQSKVPFGDSVPIHRVIGATDHSPDAVERDGCLVEDVHRR